FGERTRFTTTLFRSDTEQDIVTGPAPFPGRNTFVNAARTRREGAELAAEAATAAGLELFLAYTYTRARFDEFVNFAGVDLSGGRIPGVPEQSAYAELNWRHEPTGLVTGLEARWVGKVYVDDANSAATEDYGVLNLHLGLRHDVAGWQLREFLRVDNVTGERYVGSVIVNAANARYFEPAPGRTFFLGVAANYLR
ncbi:MAG TPA: TonB-dependent receptor, partial [Steroidobacteraceae bacterium]|nr:TonB-dependent receptor [Steroidobacteraceae bacterium]